MIMAVKYIVGEKRMALRVLYTRETGLLFEDNIPKYADWLETRMAEIEESVESILTNKNLL